jgi:hypothetical protein
MSLDADLVAIAIAGADSLAETVVIHRPSRSLVVADLMFHLLEPKGFVSNLAFAMMGVRNKLAQSRAWRMATKDRDAAQASVERLLAHDFDRLVPTHGDVIDTGAHARVTDALSWMARRTGATERLRSA